MYVYSTLACDTAYAVWQKGGGDLPIMERTILVKGGAGVANDRLITPNGVATEISEADFDVLKENKVFQKHVEGGYISFDKKKVDADVAAVDMEHRDVSAPIVPGDYDADKEPIAGEPARRGRPRKA